MASAARIREAEEVSTAFHQALVQMGVVMAVESLTLWRDVPAQPGVPGWARWVPRILQLVLLRRRQARELSEAYYRLNRALMTGRTIVSDGETPGEYTSLDTLRDEFSDIIGYNYAQPPLEGAPAEDVADDDEPELDDEDAEAERILLEEIANLDEEADQAETDAQEAIETTLDMLSKAAMEAKLAEAQRAAETVDDLDGLRSEAHQAVGTRTAAAMARHTMNGARSSIFARATRDPAVLGYVRVSQSGTPCAFCAMLMSREVFYKTEASASFERNTESLSYEDGDRYHDNCMCYPMPVYEQGQYDTSDKFALNREYREMWPKVTAGLGGRAARAAWRRYIYATQRAQVAAQTNNVQEA